MNTVSCSFFLVLYAETPISGSPFTCNVFDASRIRVGPIPHGIVGVPVKFQGSSPITRAVCLLALSSDALHRGIVAQELFIYLPFITYAY